MADFDPVALRLGPLAIHWYALAYLAGFLLGWRYVLWLIRRARLSLTPEQVGDFLNWAIIAVLAGGRLGYVVFYNLPYYLQHPLEIFYLWQGGMSFHGGVIGLVVALFGFAARRGVNPFTLGDLVAAAGPLGLFLGRLTNFINGELYGRPTLVPWGVIFPRAGDGVARHPSQLYEAGLEGAVLFLVLFLLCTRTSWLREAPGRIASVFLTGYALFRFGVEFFREPDAQLGFLYAGATMGQLLCLPLALFGIWLFFRTRPRHAP